MSKRKPIKLSWKDGVATDGTSMNNRQAFWGPLEFRVGASIVRSGSYYMGVQIYMWDSYGVKIYKSIPAAKRAAVRICERLRDSIPKEEL